MHSTTFTTALLLLLPLSSVLAAPTSIDTTNIGTANANDKSLKPRCEDIGFMYGDSCDFKVMEENDEKGRDEAEREGKIVS